MNFYLKRSGEGTFHDGKIILDCMYYCAYYLMVEFEWDIKKSLSNLKKHGIDFADALSVLEDERAITITEEHSDEDRFITIGMDIFGRILVFIYTIRGKRIRVISARKASVKEIKEYMG
jgi:uncharacterized DUF497 family protein